MKAGRILHLIPGMGGGGAERQLAYLASELVRRGWEVHVGLVSEGPNFDRLRRSGATIHRITAANNHDPRLLLDIVRLVGRIQPDLIQVWMLQMEVVGAIAATLRRVPLIWSERCSEEAYPPSLKHRLREWMARRSRAIVANSPEGARYWSGRVAPGVPREVIPNALPLDEIGSVAAVDERASGIPASDGLLLFAGRLTSQKAPETAIEALASVLRTPGRVAVIAGEGPMRQRLEAQTRAHGLEDRVRFPGYLTNLWAWMKRADVFLSPSRFEGHPNTVLEAAACGCPLVISDIAAHREFLDETAARFVPPGDVRGLAGALEEALGHPTLARARAERAAERVAQWSVERSARDYEQVYFDVMGRARG